MFRRASLIAFTLTAVAALSACSMMSATPDASKKGASAALVPQRYVDAGKIRVAALYPYPPMTYLDNDGNLTGFDYDLGQALGDKLGVEFEVMYQEWPSIIPSLQADKHDIIISSMNDTVEREKTLDYIDYFGGGFSILVPKGNPEGITGLSDLCGKTVAIPEATAQGKVVEAASLKCPAGTSINITYLPVDGDAQEALRAGKVSADIQDASISSFTAMTAGDGKYFDTVPNGANPDKDVTILTGIGVLKGNDGLVKALQAGVQELMDDGTYMTLLKKYNLQDFGLPMAMINGAGKLSDTL